MPVGGNDVSIGYFIVTAPPVEMTTIIQRIPRGGQSATSNKRIPYLSTDLIITQLHSNLNFRRKVAVYSDPACS